MDTLCVSSSLQKESSRMKTLVKILVRIVVLWGRAHRLPVVE